MAKFCGKCGSMLNEQTGKCPNCDKAVKPEAPVYIDNSSKNTQPQVQDNKKAVADKKGKKSKKALVIVIVAFVLLIIATAGVTGALVYADMLDIPFVNGIFYTLGLKEQEETEAPRDDVSDYSENVEITEAPTSPEEEVDLSVNYEVPEFDAEKYFRENTTLINSFAVATSKTVRTESDAYKDFNDRGFTSDVITYDYSIEGEYLGAIEISRYSSDKHPMYQTYYTSQTGEVWMITEVNGAFFAMPMLYNYSDEGKIPVILSESDNIVSYDSTTNKFYVNVPDASDALVKKVAKIDSKALDKLTSEGIDKL